MCLFRSAGSCEQTMSTRGFSASTLSADSERRMVFAIRLRDMLERIQQGRAGPLRTFELGSREVTVTGMQQPMGSGRRVQLDGDAGVPSGMPRTRNREQGCGDAVEFADPREIEPSIGARRVR